jgi:DNA-binding NarL/FixJ family response regulator
MCVLKTDSKRDRNLRREMGSASTAGRTPALAAMDEFASATICLLSSHAGQLAEMERLLSGGQFKLRSVRFSFGMAEEAGRVRMPRASVYVIDTSSPRVATESLIEAIRSRFPKARVIVVKETLQDVSVFPYLRLGVKGVVRYADIHEDLKRAIQVVIAGGFWISGSQLVRFVDLILNSYRRQAEPSGPSYLTRREREVLMSILQGLSNKEIGGKLHISERTVKFHVSHLLTKFKAQRRADLIAKHYQVWPVNAG